MRKPSIKGLSDETPAVWESPKNLRPWSQNPKPLSGEDVREMVASIRRFGFGAPIVARRESKEIIEGHLRHAASLSLKLDRVPVRYLDLSEDEAQLLAVAAIQFEGRRKTDADVLSEVLTDFSKKGINLDTGTGFSDKDLESLLAKTAGLESPKPKKSLRSDSLMYRILVDCDDEMHQAEVLTTLEAQGLKCKPVIS